MAIDQLAVSKSRIVAAIRAVSRWGESAKYCGTLIVLLALGVFGHQTHWDFGLAKQIHAENHESDKVPVGSGDVSTSDGWVVQFPNEKSVRRSGVKLQPIEQRSIRELVKVVGVVTYDERMTATLSPRVSGTVWRVLKQVGDSVHKGDVLVIIDAAEVGRAKAEFLSELVSVESKAEVLRTLEAIEGAVAGRRVREAHVALREAKIRLQNAEQTLINLGLSVNKDEFSALKDAERAEKIAFLGLPESIVKSLDRQRTTSNLLPLTASFDGVVIHQTASLGEMVDVGKPILDIVDLRRMWLKMDVPKEDASKLAIGQPVRFTPDGFDQELESRIAWISTEMNEQTRTLKVRAEVENPVLALDQNSGHEVRSLRANTFGTGTIVLRESESAFVVPMSAVLHVDNQAIVFVRGGDLSFRSVEVQLGVRDGQQIQIESNELRSGLEIVTAGSHVLKSEWILNHLASSGP